MREFKFRSWNNGFVFFDLIEDNDCDFYRFYCSASDIVEQYTGLKDKNGKEIYEGDIVRRCEEGGFNDIVGVVEWSEKAARFWVNSYYYPNGKNWVVVGNIHENPELLKGENNG